MKKLLFSLAILSAIAVTAQVGINTDEPKAMLDISAKDDQKGDLRIQDVEEEKSTQWLLIWDEKDQKVKRTNLSGIKREILNEIRIDYIRKKQPARAGDIINKIKQCTPENILFDKHFGDGKHDFVYCATIVSDKVGNKEYNKTWLNLNLGAAYADINSPNFNPTVNKTGEAIHSDENLYGSLYQWQRASDGHEFRDSDTALDQAKNWVNTGDSVGKFITGSENWVKDGSDASGSELRLWQAGGVNNPCPSGYHVPTIEEWDELLNVLGGGNKVWSQTKLPNLAAAGFHRYVDGLLYYKGSRGYYWSSSASDSSYARYMYFRSSYSGTNGINRRAYGYSVRCIEN
ncbi:Fibrobacter succinogenes major paralogous domain [Candidatus Ornithobacterium hominis]|uniref:FISUMP domain-containing protein n=1 Tax=Candidatus Ornithobacterium hominis TaxID=2497989 RepID=UPI0024BD0350|nr:FISUMP domain-containing protein [Candidatus Ornithobacterium hominis]CAI9429781.1 Fibrobacter succinogenes major paralogous domain [Candidatus Ornithobacterium hominis]